MRTDMMYTAHKIEPQQDVEGSLLDYLRDYVAAIATNLYSFAIDE